MNHANHKQQPQWREASKGLPMTSARRDKASPLVLASWPSMTLKCGIALKSCDAELSWTSSQVLGLSHMLSEMESCFSATASIGSVGYAVAACRKTFTLSRRWIEDFPPIPQPMRFGNKAFRQWCGTHRTVCSAQPLCHVKACNMSTGMLDCARKAKAFWRKL